jgi:multiple sugar transport system permease protein
VSSQAPGLADTPTPPFVPVAAGAEHGPRRPRFTPTWAWARNAVFIAILLFLTVLFIYPFLWALSASLKPRGYVFDNKLIPTHWRFYNYVEIWHVAPVLHWFWNSFYIAVLASVTMTFSSALTAFAFAYFRFPGRNFLFGCVLSTMMLPAAVTMIPRYLIFRHVGLAESQYPLWVTNIFGFGFYIFLQRQFFLGIPRELFEAARMDGDNFFTMFWRIAVPLAKPALIVTGIFEFQASWTDLQNSLIYLHSDSSFTIPRGLYGLLSQFSPQTGGNGDYELILAATILATLPLILVFFLAQRYFIEGISLQGRKG